jgi:hypothetical protein
MSDCTRGVEDPCGCIACQLRHLTELLMHDEKEAKKMKTIVVGPTGTTEQRGNMEVVRQMNPTWHEAHEVTFEDPIGEVVLLQGWREDADSCMVVLLALLRGVKVRGYAEVKDPVVPDELTLDLMVDAAMVVAEVIGGNSERHGGHVEWLSRAASYHAGKAGGHAADAGLMASGQLPPANGEGAVEHFNGVIVRGLMGRWIARKNEQKGNKR